MPHGVTHTAARAAYSRSNSDVRSHYDSVSNMPPGGNHNATHTLDPNLNHYQPQQNRHAVSNARTRNIDRHYVGAEPGVNPRRGDSIAQYSHLKQACVIDVIDYDTDDVLFRRLTNDEFVKLMHDEPPGKSVGPDADADGEEDDEDWPPKAVRWINIGGLDWNVLSAVALRYNLHSLALEDVLHEQGHNQSKADYYPEHLFLRVLCHTLAKEAPDSAHIVDHQDNKYPQQHQPNGPPGNGSTECGNEWVSGADEDLMERGKAKSGEGSRNGNGNNNGGLENMSSTMPILAKKSDQGGTSHADAACESLKRKQHEVQAQALKEDDRVRIKHEPMFIFLLRDGTVICTHQTPNLEYTQPITERLHRRDSVLRTSEDASLLVESLLDLVVDRILEMMDEYQRKIHKLEHEILLTPDMNTVRQLHILSGDLIMHKRTLDPIKAMIYGLRQYDIDRCTALADHFQAEYGNDDDSIMTDIEEKAVPEGKKKGKKGKRQQRREQQRARRKRERDEEMKRWIGQRKMGHQKQKKPQGYFSYKAKVYLADVYDHMDFALTSLDMFAGISENLINYAFNVASYEMNEVMKRLTTVTIIFLPLTLLTGYFGMNFTAMWSVQNNSDLLFWEIAIPTMFCLIPIFMYTDIVRTVKYIRQKMTARAAAKNVRR